MARLNEYRRSWKTIRILRIAGVAFAYQQEYSMHGSIGGHSGGHAGFVTVPEGNHRLIPLLDLIDNEDQVLEAIAEQKDLTE